MSGRKPVLDAGERRKIAERYAELRYSEERGRSMRLLIIMLASALSLSATAYAEVSDELIGFVAKRENFSPIPFVNGHATGTTAAITVCKGQVLSGTAIFVIDRQDMIHKIPVETRIGNCAFKSDRIGRAVLEKCHEDTLM